MRLFLRRRSLGEMAGCVNENPAKLGRRRYIKYVLWIIWLLSILLLYIKSGGIKAIDPFYATINGISITSAPEYIVYYGVIALLFGLPLFFGKRAFCHYLCWMAPFMNLGLKIRNLLHLPGLSLHIDKKKCTHCTRCTKHCPMGLDVEKMIHEKGISENDCSLCGACVDICKEKAISYRFKKKK